MGPTEILRQAKGEAKNRFKHILVWASFKYHPHPPACAVQTEQEVQCAGHYLSTLCLQCSQGL